MSEGFTMNTSRLITGVIAGAIGAMIENLSALFICILVFEVVDFVTGCWKSAVVARRAGGHFAFESVKAWRTIYKVVFIMIGIVLAEMLDMLICEERIRLANIFTAFACGVEFWSFLENAAVISDHPIFRWLRKFMKSKVDEHLGVNDGNDNEGF